jgi:large subunit ribosomal protein L19
MARGHRGALGAFNLNRFPLQPRAYQYPTQALTSHLIQEQAKRFLKKVPDIQPGYTLRVHERIQEGNKERVQIFEGLVISVHRGHVPTDASFTVRRIVSGIGVEKVFPVHAPTIEKIEVKKVARARRAKLYFIRGRAGKSARLDERFTNEDEFKVEQDAPAAKQSEEQAAEAAPVVEEKKEEAQA